ncbi:MAG TPA: AI-2E family transporter [Chloroflexi bacterium]|nr:AI-2E family transporter [Chloroflexota bacterium]
MSETAQRWDPATKRIVALSLLVLLVLVLYRFRGVLPPLVLSFLLAFILDPVVDFLEVRLRMSRTNATALVFALVVLTMLTAPVVATPLLVRAGRSLDLDFTQILADVGQFVARPVTLFGLELDLRSVYLQLRQTLDSFLSGVFKGTVNVVVGFASTLFWLVFILISSFYLLRDAERIATWMDSLAPPPFHDDFVRLRQRITEVWHAFLRGQLLMAFLLAVITTTVTTAVGLPHSLELGFLAGVMEFIPNIGPIIAAIPAVAVALFEGSSWLPLSNLWFAVLVLGLYVLIQQVEGNLLLPRVLGRGLNLHPLIVLVAVIGGGNLAGILGMLLAAPTVATVRILGEYIYCRLTDQEPFPEAARPPVTRRSLSRRLWDRVRRLVLAGQWVVRPARLEDRPDVEAICAQIWEGHDYVPEAWEEWLADPYGELSVVERKGRVVGVGKLTRVADREWWLEGLRVDPAYRRLGVARLLQAHQVQLAERFGRGVLRLGTASNNRAVHRNAARDGFHRVAEFLAYSADPLPGPCPLRLLAVDDLQAVWELIEGSPILKAAGGLYEEVAWHWVTLTRERLAAHLSAGEVWGVDIGERLAAVAVVLQDRRTERLLGGYLDGEPDGLIVLVWGLRVLACQRGREVLRLRPPTCPLLQRSIEQAGGTRIWEHGLWIFERPLGSGEGSNDRSNE